MVRGSSLPPGQAGLGRVSLPEHKPRVIHLAPGQDSFLDDTYARTFCHQRGEGQVFPLSRGDGTKTLQVRNKPDQGAAAFVVEAKTEAAESQSCLSASRHRQDSSPASHRREQPYLRLLRRALVRVSTGRRGLKRGNCGKEAEFVGCQTVGSERFSSQSPISSLVILLLGWQTWKTPRTWWQSKRCLLPLLWTEDSRHK